MSARVRTILAVLAIALCGAAPQALAHAVLLSSDPAAEAVVDVAPTEIRLGFNENVGPIFVRVLDQSGQESGNPGPFRVDGNDVYLPLEAALPDGTYVLTYRVISADTHPVGGSVLFAVGEPLADLSALTDATPIVSGWRFPVAVNRFALYTGGALAAGSALLAMLLALPPAVSAVARRQGRLASAVAALALVLGIGLGGAEMLAAGASALFSPATWRTGAASTLGTSALLGVPGAVLLFRSFESEGERSAAATLGALLLIGSFLVTGHAATASPAWVMALVVGVHFSAVAFWVAALWPLERAAATLDANDSIGLLERFSTRAIVAVSLLAVSGIAIAWVQVETRAALTTTDYGVRLLLKLVLVGVVLVLAALNKHIFTRRLRDGSGSNALRRSIRVEMALMLAILAAAVSLTLPSPPRALAALNATSESTAFRGTVTNRDITATIEVTPASPGENMLMLSFVDADGAPVDVVRLRVVLALPAASLDGIEKEGVAVSPGVYHLTVSEMIIPGDWEIRIDAFVDDFDKRILRTTIPIR